jgi:hypothetical protein
MAPAWFSSFVDRLRAARTDPSSAQERRVARLLAERPSFGDEASFVAAMIAELGGAPIGERTVEIIAAHLGPGEAADPDEHLPLWTFIAERSSSHLARACRADCLLASGERGAALAEFIDAVDGDPTLVHFHAELRELAREHGGQAWLRYRLSCLRAALAGFRPNDEDEEGDDDYVRELYCELLEEYRGDADALARVRELGALIDEAASRGELPRAIVRRAPRG